MNNFERGFLRKPAVKKLLESWPDPRTEDQIDRELAERSQRERYDALVAAYVQKEWKG